MEAFNLQLGRYGAGRVQLDDFGQEPGEFSLTLRPSHGGSEYRIVAVTDEQLAQLSIALFSIPSVRETLEAVRAMLP